MSDYQSVRPILPIRGRKVAAACDQCRKRKSKCNEAKPCFACVEEGNECTYQPIQKTSVEKKYDNMKAQMEAIERQITDFQAAFLANYRILPLSLNSRTAYVYQRAITSAHEILQWPSSSKFVQGIDALNELSQKKQPISAYVIQLGMSQSECDYSRTNAKTDGAIPFDDELSTLLRLHGSYLQNTHPLFPFMDPDTLEEWINEWHADNMLSPIQRAIVMLVAALGDLSMDTSRNDESRPGLQYYIHAADALAYQQEGTTLEHAQAQTLAALYLIQEARVKETWYRISNACRITAFLAYSDRDDLFEKAAPLTMERQMELEPLLCLYWACRDLEAEIIADMPSLPASEMQVGSETIREPVGIFPKERVQTFWLYHSQRTLFKTLHYDSNSYAQRDEAGVIKYTQAHLAKLKNWRSLLPSDLNWKDEDPPSTYMELARMRGVFYDFKCRALLPCAKLVINEFRQPTVEREDSIQATISQYALDCIEAAIQYLIAFDRVGAAPESFYKRGNFENLKRPVVSNLFSTLHAQFGCVLVLIVLTANVGALAGSVPTEAELQALIVRTVAMYDVAAPPSKVLDVNLAVMANAWQKLADDISST